MANFDKNDTREKMVVIAVDMLGVDKDSVQDTSTFESLGADSLDMVEMIMKMEEVFGIEISDEDADKIKVFKEALDYVHERRTK
ncbi:MAG: Acyl carrier protein [candidate division TM6 bacterium GW2011_GWF2_32_72]|nr:MAG: Acyl carrier protein [candidate division TM6 bacterium GW2011_GWF2_32_72]